MANKVVVERAKNICGIVMPISGFGEYSEAHWGDVLEIITDSAQTAGFDANLVSAADDVGIIQKRIIQNLYENPIVVCDVSGKNANVMFELGMRLAFDKPTIIIKDDMTSYSFDTSPIEHIEYPRDLRFSRIVEFKAKLAEKIKATVEKAEEDADYTTFLKHFGEFKVAVIDKKVVSGEEYIIEELKTIRLALDRLERPQPGVLPQGLVSQAVNDQDRLALYEILFSCESDEVLEMASASARAIPGATLASSKRGDGVGTIRVRTTKEKAKELSVFLRRAHGVPK